MLPLHLLIVAATLSLAAAAQALGQGRSPRVSASVETAAAKAFLAKNAKEPGVVTLPDGLQYKIVSSGPATGMQARTPATR